MRTGADLLQSASCGNGGGAVAETFSSPVRVTPRQGRGAGSPCHAAAKPMPLSLPGATKLPRGA